MTLEENKKWLEIRKETKDDEAASHLWVRWKCLTDLFFLGYEILGLREAKDRNTGRRLVDPVFHKWLCEVLSTNDDVMIIVPRRHMKTTWVKIKLIQNILKNPFIRQAMYSSTTSLVTQELASIKRMLTSARLMALFPEDIPDPGKRSMGWQRSTAEELTVKRDATLGTLPQENQIEVYGAGSTVTGKHFDIHIYDDLINENTTRTMEQVNKTREWYGYIQGVLEPGGQEIYIGTPYHYADLVTFIRTENIYSSIFKRSVIENGKIIYSYFTHKMLDKIKKRMTPYQWSCQWECDPMPMEDQLFPSPQPQYEGELPKGKYNFYISVDPAATTKTWSDETAIIVGAVDEQGALFVLEAFHFKKPGNETAEMILMLNEKYKPRKIGIELGIQEHLRYIIDNVRSGWESAQNKRITLPVEEIKISRTDKYNRINLTLGSFVRSGKIFINSKLVDLMTQMQLYNRNYSGKDDLVDALSMMFQIVEQFSFRYWQNPLGLIKNKFFIFQDMFKKKEAVGYNDRFAQ